MTNQELRNNLAIAYRRLRDHTDTISQQACRVDQLKHELRHSRATTSRRSAMIRELQHDLAALCRLIRGKHFDEPVGRTAVDAARIAQHNPLPGE